MNIVICIIYFLIGIYMISNLIKKNKKNKFVGCYSGVSFGMILYYCIIPILVIMNNEQITTRFPNIKEFISGKSFWELLFPIILVLLGFFIFNCAYNQSNKSTKINDIEFSDKKTINISKIIGYFTLIVGGISLLVYFAAFGGIRNAFSYAEIFRSFNTSATDYISGTSSILIIPARLITVAPFAFYILIKERKTSNKLIFKIFFVISIILSIMFYIFNAGRAPLLYFVLSFGMIYIYKFIKKPWKYIILLAIVAMPILDILDSFSLYLQSGNWRTIEVDYLSYIYQFSYPFKNIINMVDMTDMFGLRWGVDFITSILGLIPGINFPVSYENTSLFYGGVDWRVTGGTPNDLITFSFIEFGVLGIPLIFSGLGYIIGKIDKALKKIPKSSVKTLLCSAMAIHVFGIIPSADFSSFIRGSFIIICLSIVILNSYTRRE